MLDLRLLPGPYHAAADLASWDERHAAGTRPYVAVMPDSTARALPPLVTLEDRVTVPIGSLLWAISGSSSQAAGFSVQITDSGSKKPLFSQSVHFSNATGQGTILVPDCSGALHAIATPLHQLAKPMVILPPGLVDIQITNIDVGPLANTVQICLHFLCPDTEIPPPPPNAHNFEVATSIALARRAMREAVTKSGPVMNHVPFSLVAAGNNVVIAGSPGARITIYELDLWNVGQQTIILMDGPDRLRGPLTDFPAQAGRSWDDTGKPHFQLTAGRSFVLNLSVGTEVSGYVRYRME